LNYKNTCTHVIFVLRVTKHFTQASADALSRQGRCMTKVASGVSLPGMRTVRVWRHGRRTVRGHPRSPHFSLAVISVNVQFFEKFLRRCQKS